MKIYINGMPNKIKTHGIDTQKWTLAYISYKRVWCAYNTQFLCTYMIQKLLACI